VVEAEAGAAITAEYKKLNIDPFEEPPCFSGRKKGVGKKNFQ
jgi:hypothetical protein